MTDRLSFPTLVILAGFLVALSGCRTYGGYGATDAAVTTLTRANDIFESELGQARRDAERLAAAARVQPQLRPYTASFAGVVSLHEQALAQGQDRAESLAGGTTYRSASRTLGATIADYDRVRSAYRNVVNGVAITAGVMPSMGSTSGDSGYGKVPPFYYRIDRPLTIVQALGG